MRRLLLVGGGHAHLEVLRSLALRPLAGVEVMLLSPESLQPYSSMLPGFLRHRYEERELTFDLAAIAGRAGARYLRGAALRVDGAARTVKSEEHSLDFDIASIDVGGGPSGLDTPGAAEHALFVRPWSTVLELRRRLDALAASGSGGDVAVVGAGAGGTEVAIAIGRRLSARRTGSGLAVRLLERAGSVLEEFPPRARKLACDALEDAGVRVRTGATVVRVEAEHVLLQDGEIIPAAMTLWIGGSAPPALARGSDLPRDEGGYFEVDPTLRSTGGAPVFGAGDCVALSDHPGLPRAGVYAVRQAPVLAHNLRATLSGTRTRRYDPQPRFLALLDTADGGALLRYGPFAFRGRTAGRLKRIIDARFMRRYKSLYGAR